MLLKLMGYWCGYWWNYEIETKYSGPGWLKIAWRDNAWYNMYSVVKVIQDIEN